MKVIMPIAGLGSRFKAVADQNPAYRAPKPFIDVRGRPMVRWATASLPFLRHPEEEIKPSHLAHPEDIIFILLKIHDDEWRLKEKLHAIYSEAVQIVKLESLTRGAAETALFARPLVAEDEPIIISDSDHFFIGDNLLRAISERGPDVAGIIPVFRARNEGIPKWSYSLTVGDSPEITRVAEKDRELMESGAYANIGAYFFSEARFFFEEAEAVVRKDERSGEHGKSEFYIAPLYDRLIQKGRKIHAAFIPKVFGLGTPSDLEFFLKSHREDLS